MLDERGRTLGEQLMLSGHMDASIFGVGEPVVLLVSKKRSPKGSRAFGGFPKTNRLGVHPALRGPGSGCLGDAFLSDSGTLL